MARKLASIERVWKVEPIEGADKIELAHVLGWQCVVNKGQFKPMDLGVYFEIDSFLPVQPEFEFLRGNSYRKSDIMGEGFKLKTMRFKGQLSQGLLLPLSVFGDLFKDATVGQAVASTLGVRKWEEEERATTGGTVIGDLPYDVPRTDETRLQACPELLEEFRGLEYYISTKMDGSSHSISIDTNGVHVTGHNYEYKDDGSSSFYEFVKKNGYLDRIMHYAETHQFTIQTLTIQGEFCAPGVQGNPVRLTRPEWYVFTVRVNGKRVSLDEMLKICRDIDIPTVPIEERGFDLPSKYPTVDAVLERAEGYYSTGSRKEGIVIRPTEPVFSKTIGASLSMKAVSNTYLLKKKGD